ncbi:MAG: DUF4430 domain-containing protein [Halobacteriovoraceae bacterium]|nr:DUF4430 domain-containing protein [Halobacteriovoraceae bacterium]
MTIIGPCDEKPLFTGNLPIGSTMSVGAFSIKAFEQNNIEYKGTVAGVNSIFNTPMGLDAMEVLSDTEMRAHGWCYSVNGKSPEVFPDKFYIEDDADVVWWFGYALYLDGEWITQCSPTHLIAPEQFCSAN